LPEAIVQRIGECTNLDQLIAATRRVPTLDKLESLQL
jgi:hypothetical protein